MNSILKESISRQCSKLPAHRSCRCTPFTVAFCRREREREGDPLSIPWNKHRPANTFMNLVGILGDRVGILRMFGPGEYIYSPGHHRGRAPPKLGLHTRPALLPKGKKGRDSAAGIARKSSSIRPGAATGFTSPRTKKKQQKTNPSHARAHLCDSLPCAGYPRA